MRGNSKKRVGFSLLATAAFAGLIGFVGGPAYGQSAGVGNSGQADASTGGNSSVGNASHNTADNGAGVSQPPSDSLVGGLLGLVVNVGGGASNDSSGTSNVNTGAAQATGNNSDTAVDQSAGGGGHVRGTVFGPSQSAGVSNSGDATADTGGNQSVGNQSTNIATNDQSVTGGLLAVGINLGGGAHNRSTGTSNITTGPATAAGNEAVTTVNQERVGRAFHAGGGAACDGFFRFAGQSVEIENAGSAAASTGNNASVGNQSTNVATNDQSVSGGLIGLGVNLGGLLGGPGGATNQSDGTSNITTGAATATGNRSTTQVSQQQCVEPAAFHHPVITPTIVEVIGHHKVLAATTHQLAKTGVDPFVIGLVAFSLLFAGLLFLVWERAEKLSTTP